MYGQMSDTNYILQSLTYVENDSSGKPSHCNNPFLQSKFSETMLLYFTHQLICHIMFFLTVSVLPMS